MYINVMARIHPSLSPQAQRTLRKLGEDIRTARLRRRLPMEIVAERALIARATLHKVERGDPAVSIGIYAMVLLILGFIERLALVADVSYDSAGLAMEEERLPQRIRLPSHPQGPR